MKSNSKKLVGILGGVTVLAIMLTGSVFAATSSNYSEEAKKEYSFQTGIVNGSKYENAEGDDDFEYTPNWSEEKKAEYSYQTGKVNGVKNAE